MNIQKFLKELNVIDFSKFPFKWEVAFLAQDYDGKIHGFNKKPIPYTKIVYGKEHRIWDRTDEVPNSVIELVNDELGLFDNYDTKIIMLNRFNKKDITKMKKKVLSI